ncbi:MAG: thiolase family protein [Pirellulales bacterium]|nr:thiolase family protein [Pirellulales bacterium]
MSQPVIVDAVRTPFGRGGSATKAGGYFRETRPDMLLAHCLKALVERNKLDPARIDDVVTGCVSQAGEQGANIGRLGVLLAGFPVSVPAVTLNRMCGSSQQAAHFAAQEVAAGDADFTIGCGVEHMSRVPMFSDVGSLDKLNPELFTRFELVHQGESAERMAEKWKLTRQDVDEFSMESHRRASRAAKEGRNKEIIPTEGLAADGSKQTFTRDEGIRDSLDPAKIASLPTVFRPNGVVTAANSSQVSDGAAAVLIANREVAQSMGLKPRARFLARVAVGDDPTLQLAGVIPATQKALKHAGLSIKDIDWFEINEAFATVVLGWARELKPDMAKVNPWGGAIAHGHPLGATGAALMAKMVNGLEATGGKLGLQTMCIGHGMATCTIIERI